MIEDLSFLSQTLLFTQALIFCRIAAIVVAMPGLSDPSISTPIKVAFSLFLTLAISAHVVTTPMAIPSGMESLLSCLVREIMIGTFIGLCSRVLFLALELIGTIYAQQIGFSNAVLFNPFLGHEASPIGTLMIMSATLVVFTTDLHHYIFEGIAESYKILPLQTEGPWQVESFYLGFVKVLATSFQLAIKISAPILILGTVFYVALGVLNRLMPQMPIFFVAQPAQILVGLLVLFLSFKASMSLFLDKYKDMWLDLSMFSG
ncbi:MAG: flagellar biosynthetic protein FliR [Alphaproteobacteria bacterium]|nr:flagellar biosynthetic protein FliR [Alphaproteobacteria bacterium]OJV44946.1 MAG: flagellar biosynthetic protein FliR [Alphaproteobacteria bacterium 43-37]